MPGFPFVGRADVLAELSAALADARAGRGALVALTGAAGAGKTRTAEETALRAEGFRVVWVSCPPGTAANALRPWSVAARELATGDLAAGRLVRASPVLRALVSGRAAGGLRSTAPEADRLRLAGDVVELVRTSAAGIPLLLVLDDVQEADASSVGLLLELAAGVRTAAALLLATARDDAAAWRGAPSARAALLRTARCLPLGPLDRAEVSALAEAATGARPDPAVAGELLVRTGGDAFFVTELLRHRRPGRPVPPSVRAAVQARLAELPAGCARALAAASALGTDFRLDLLAEVAEVPLGDLRAVLSEAAAAGLLAMVDPGSAAFRHDLMREATYAAMSAQERVGWHQRAAEVLTGFLARGRDVGPAQVAHQLLLAGPERAGEAAVFARRAGARAADLLGYEDAAQWYERAVAALGAAGAPDEVLAEALVELGTARVGAGGREAARADFLRAAACARRCERSDLLAAAALGLGAGPAGFEVDLLDRAQVDLLVEARAALAPRRPDLLAAVTARLSVAATLIEAGPGRLALAEEAVATARRSEDSATLAYALSALCDARAGPAHCAERLAWSAEITGLARALPDLPLELLGRRLQVVALLELGETARAEAETLAFRAAAHALRHPLYAWYVPLWQGMRALLEGRYEDCRRSLDQVEELGRRAGSGNAALLAATQRWCLLTASDDRAGIAELIAGSPGLDEVPDVWAKVTRALVAAQLGDLGEAERRLAAVTPLLAGAPQDSEWLPMLAQAAETVALCGPVPPARQVYEWLSPYRDLFVVEGVGAAVRGPVHRHLGLLATALGDRGAARRHFDAALAAARGIGAAGLVERISREAGAPAPGPAAGPGGNVFRRTGDLWQLGYGGEQATMADSKGMRDLATLLARPGTPVPALDLVTARGPGAPGAAARSGEALRGPGDTGELIDATARGAYRARLRELEGEATEADAAGDAERSARIAVERDALVGQLSAAYGLGGRVRRTGSPAERARTAVTARVRAAIDRIAHAHPVLGRHLANAVHTGTLCVYEPEHPVEWRT
ncbi:ATP-binding protein [Kitasatospora sp. NPDC057015]|uniref:ATP-binding protein n=1 Tax=Kitasatospora sp. NPDC057015 TaxID=3346001 RepID=UPI003625B6A4